jgi:erythromycin esterase-like protein
VLAGQNAALAEAVEVIDSGQNAILAIEEVVDARLRAIGRQNATLAEAAEVLGYFVANIDAIVQHLRDAHGDD